MKKYYVFTLPLLFSFLSYTMESSIIIENLFTRIRVNNETHELYAMLKYPTDVFGKTIVFNAIEENSSFIIVKQGKLNSLTQANAVAISNGYATYQYGLKSSTKDLSNMDIGGLVINSERSDRYKDKNYLARERKLICDAAVIKKIEKNSKKIDK